FAATLWSARRPVSETVVVRYDTSTPRGAVRPERRARPRADESAFAGARAPPPRGPRGAPAPPARPSHKIGCDGECAASYAWPLRVSTLLYTLCTPLLGMPLRAEARSPHETLGDRRGPGLLSAC